MRLSNKRAVVTGGGSGIGQATAQMFARHGASVVVADINKDAGSGTVESIRIAGGNADYVHTDVTDAEEVAKLIAEADTLMAGIDVWVNCVGMSLGPSLLHDIEPGQWTANIELNLTSQYLCCRGVLPVMIRGGGGSILSISSVNGLWCIGEFAYSAAKAAVVSMVKNIAVNYGPEGIRANVICPGSINSPRGIEHWKKNPGAEKRKAKWYPLGRLGEPEDVANLAVFLASDESSFMTGATLVLDGGLTAGSRFFGQDLGNFED